MFASRTWTSLRSSSFPPKPTAAASARTTRRSSSTAGSAALRRRTRAVGWSSAALRGRSCVGTAHHELGFGRLGDYSRERIGLSARELQSLATVSAHLERLPPLRAAFAELDWSAIREALPDDVDGLDADANTLDPFALDARMRAVLRAMRRADWQLGRLLRVFLDRRLYRLMEFPSAERYVTERLGLSPRKARALIALERKTWQADALGTAYRAGELSWVRALTILPILAEPTAAAWVERAGAVPVRRLADEVEWALTVREGLAPIAPPPPGASLALDERQLCTRPEWEFPDAEVAFSAPVSVVALSGRPSSRSPTPTTR